MIPARALFAPVAVVALALAPAACTTPSENPGGGGGGGEPGPPPATDPAGAPVFPAPPEGEVEGLIRRAGLNATPVAEAPATHAHAHVEVIIDAKEVTVPAGLGIVVQDGQRTAVSPVYTRDDSGVVHLDPRSGPYRAGQLFVEWGVVLDKSCVATFCVDERNQLLAFANGELAPDPAAVPIAEGIEVVIWYGPRGTNPQVPTSYDFTTVTEG